MLLKSEMQTVRFPGLSMMPMGVDTLLKILTSTVPLQRAAVPFMTPLEE